MKITFGQGKEPATLESTRLSQHGMITGATGTGKSVTVRVLAEALAEAGIPVFLSDVKGDYFSMAKASDPSEHMKERGEQLSVSDYSSRSFPLQIWDVFGDCIPLRVSLLEMGPVLLSLILELNETQQAVLRAAYRFADDEGLLLLDFKDLRSLLDALVTHKKEYEKLYGALPVPSIHALLRKITYLEEIGGENFFQEPSIEIADFFIPGTLQILDSRKLISSPKIYAAFLLYLLSELMENLPERSSKEEPVMVLFFEEAHVLFDSKEKELIRKLEQMVRMIRSKGVGIFFVSQNPKDLPSDISSQLGTKIIHGLRAFSPAEKKSVQAIAQTLPGQEEGMEEQLLNLKTGQVVYTTLLEDGTPLEGTVADIFPPRSSLLPLKEEELHTLLEDSPLYDKYKEVDDVESAYERLAKKAQVLEDKNSYREKSVPGRRGNSSKTQWEKGLDSFLGTVSRSIGREIARNLLGALSKRR